MHVMRIKIFASFTRMSNVKGTVKSSTGLFHKDLANLTLLSRGGLGADRGGIRSTAGGFGGSAGLIVSYCFRYAFPDRIPLTRSTIKTISSSSESMSWMV